MSLAKYARTLKNDKIGRHAPEQTLIYHLIERAKQYPGANSPHGMSIAKPVSRPRNEATRCRRPDERTSNPRCGSVGLPKTACEHAIAEFRGTCHF